MEIIFQRFKLSLMKPKINNSTFKIKFCCIFSYNISQFCMKYQFYFPWSEKIIFSLKVIFSLIILSSFFLIGFNDWQLLCFLICLTYAVNLKGRFQFKEKHSIYGSISPWLFVPVLEILLRLWLTFFPT